MSTGYVASPVRSGKKWLTTSVRVQAESRSKIPVRQCPDCRHEYQTADGRCPFCAETTDEETDLPPA